MMLKFTLLAVFGFAHVAFCQESVASPGQIAYAISQNYDQTGPGEHSAQASSSQEETSTAHQYNPTSYIHQPQQHQSQIQYTQHYTQPQQYIQPQYTYSSQPNTQTIYSNSQHLFGRHQASYSQQVPIYSHYQIPQVAHSQQVSHSQQVAHAQPSAHLSYAQPQVKYVPLPAPQPLYSHQPTVLKAVPAKAQEESHEPSAQYTYSYELPNAAASKEQESNQDEGTYSYLEPSQYFRPIDYSSNANLYSSVAHQQQQHQSTPKTQLTHQSYVASLAKTTYPSHASAKTIYQPTVAKSVYAIAPVSKISTQIPQQYTSQQQYTYSQ